MKKLESIIRRIKEAGLEDISAQVEEITAVKKDDEKTKVIFKKFEDGDIIAIFPDLPGTRDKNTCESYAHIGQHSLCNKSLIKSLKNATPQEYKDLKSELENLVGYNLDVMNEKKTSVKAASEDMTIEDFVSENRKEIDKVIRDQSTGRRKIAIDDEERRVWVLNNEGLYNMAMDEGVVISQTIDNGEIQTVGDLIKELNKFNKKTEIRISPRGKTYRTINSVIKVKGSVDINLEDRDYIAITTY